MTGAELPDPFVAELRKLAPAPGETVLICPGAGHAWSVAFCERAHDAVAALMPPGVTVLVFSANIDVGLVEDAPRGLDALAGALTVERFKRRCD